MTSTMIHPYREGCVKWGRPLPTAHVIVNLARSVRAMTFEPAYVLNSRYVASSNSRCTCDVHCDNASLHVRAVAQKFSPLGGNRREIADGVEGDISLCTEHLLRRSWMALISRISGFLDAIALSDGADKFLGLTC
jgi:hypothetical protein